MSSYSGANAPGGLSAPVSIFHDFARRYAALGWRVFPIAPGRKDPPLTPRGIYDASSDSARIDRWWQQTPDANIGVFCEGSGLHVLDIDTRMDAPVLQYLNWLQQQHGPLPPAPISRTRSGGFHALFDARGAPSDWSLKEDPLYRRAWPLVDAAGKSRKVIELKCVGYIVAPPSVITREGESDGIAGSYVWARPPFAAAPFLPPRWYQSLRREEPVRPRIVEPTGPCPARLQGLVDRLHTKGAGDRDDALYWAGNRALEEASAGAYSLSEAYDQLHAAGLAIGQRPDECRRALRKLRQAMGGGWR